MYLINQLHNGCFDNLSRVKNVLDCFFGIVLCQLLLHIYILNTVKFHLWRDKILFFVVFQLLFFLLIIVVVYFY